LCALAAPLLAGPNTPHAIWHPPVTIPTAEGVPSVCGWPWRRPNARACEKTEQALHHRQQFWMDTCRDVREMRTASRQVLKLYRQHGWLFLCPAPRQVQSVLDALDSALPGWERDHAGLFYQTLELNFPELLRVSGAQRRS